MSSSGRGRLPVTAAAWVFMRRKTSGRWLSPEAAFDLSGGFALGLPSGCVGLGGLVDAEPAQGNGCRARLSWRSPERLSRWRVTVPLLAGMGAAPAREAKAASERIRPACDQEMRNWLP